MSDPLAELRAGVVALLDAQGARALAAIVAAARVEIAGPGETWSMGARTITAHRVAIAVAAPAFAALSAGAGELDAVRSAFAHAMRSPDTELASLHLELLLPGVDRPWSRAYRDAPTRRVPDAPDPEAILAGARELLLATSAPAAAALLERAELEAAPIPDMVVPLTRYVIRLSARDRAATLRDPSLAEQIERAVRDAATRAAESVSVEIGTAPGPAPGR